MFWKEKRIFAKVKFFCGKNEVVLEGISRDMEDLWKKIKPSSFKDEKRLFYGDGIAEITRLLIYITVGFGHVFDAKINICGWVGKRGMS